MSQGIDVDKYKIIAFKQRFKCVVCDRLLEEPVIALPGLPLTEIYVTRKTKEKLGLADQYFHLCSHCGHGQISRLLPPELLYGSNYSFRTAKSRSASKANDEFLKFIDQTAGEHKFDTVLEIGCNDLYLLKAFKDRAKKVVGVDPILKGREKEFSRGNVEVVGDFFENVNFRPYLGKGRNLIICSHTLEHVVEPKQLLAHLFDQANADTWFFFQFPSFDCLLENSRYDQVFHQHLNYFSLSSFNYLLKTLKAEIVAWRLNHAHWGGSLLLAFKRSMRGKIMPMKKINQRQVKASYLAFQIRMKMMREYLRSLSGDAIYGYGAALMLPTLAYHLGMDLSDWQCILDEDKSKHGKYYLNLPVPIRRPSKHDHMTDATVVITALNNIRPIMPKVLALNPKRVVVPVNNL